MERSPLAYAFGHLVSGYASPEDAHSADSIELAHDTLKELGFGTNQVAMEMIEELAEHVAGNYTYTGALDAERGRGEGFEF